MLKKADELTEERLVWLTDIVNAQFGERVVSNYWEFVPSDSLTRACKIEYIICAISGVGSLPDKDILTQLFVGPVGGPNPHDDICAKPVMLNCLKHLDYDRKLDTVAAMHRAADVIRQHKYVPNCIKRDSDWCMLLTLMHLIDYNPEVFEPIGQMLDLTRKVRIAEDGVHTSGQVRKFIANLAMSILEFAENANSLIWVNDSTVNP